MTVLNSGPPVGPSLCSTLYLPSRALLRKTLNLALPILRSSTPTWVRPQAATPPLRLQTPLTALFVAVIPPWMPSSRELEL